MTTPTIAVYDAETGEWSIRDQTAEEINSLASLPELATPPSSDAVVEMPLPGTFSTDGDPVL